MAAFLDNVRFNPTLGGTTDWTYSSAVAGYQSPSAANVVNGTKYKYFAIDSSNNWELGEGAYNTSTGVLARTTILYSTNSNAKVSFAAAPQVAIVALKEDMISVEEANSFTATQQAQARANVGVPAANLIINGDFRINQMAYVSAATLAAGTYGHDQWKAGASGGDYSFTQLASSTQITIAASKSLIQPIESANVVGGSYVLSWTGTAQARAGVNTLTPSGSYASSPVLITGQTAATAMSVEFNTGTLGTVKLESGASPTPFIMQPSADVLFSCQRFLAAYSGQFIMVPQNSGNTFYPFMFPRAMRAVPTISGSYGQTGGSAGTVATQNVTTTSANFFNASSNWSNGFLIAFTGTIDARL